MCIVYLVHCLPKWHWYQSENCQDVIGKLLPLLASGLRHLFFLSVVNPHQRIAFPFRERKVCERDTTCMWLCMELLGVEIEY